MQICNGALQSRKTSIARNCASAFFRLPFE
jgi:hypothetical protein